MTDFPGTVITLGEPPGFAPAGLCGRGPRRFRNKMPAASWLCGVDFTQVIGTDTLRSAVVSVTPSGPGHLSVATPVIDGAVVSFRASAGFPGTDYGVLLTVAFASGDTAAIQCGLYVDNYSFPESVT